MQIAAARRLDAANRPQIFVAAGDGGGGHSAIDDQAALAVEIAQHHFEQLRALRNADAQLLPIGLVDDQRQVAERPQPVGGIAGRAVGDAGFAQMPVGGGKAPLDIYRRKCCKGIEKPAPGRAGRAVRSNIFVGNAGQARIVPRPLRHPPLAGTRPALLIVALA